MTRAEAVEQAKQLGIERIRGDRGGRLEYADTDVIEAAVLQERERREQAFAAHERRGEMLTAERSESVAQINGVGTIWNICTHDCEAYSVTVESGGSGTIVKSTRMTWLEAMQYVAAQVQIEIEDNA